MGNIDLSYQVANEATSHVTLSNYASLEKLANGKYNRGELVLKNGGFAVVNNHVHLTMLNGKVTTKQENLDVRTAVLDMLEGHFVGLRAGGRKSPALDKVKERLLGAEHRMLPITRDEVRDMINMLKTVKSQREADNPPRNAEELNDRLAFEGQLADQVLATSNRLQPARYRDYSAASVNMATTLGAVADQKLDDRQANELADLAFSRSRLYQEDHMFNALAEDFEKRFKVGTGEALTKLLGGLRQKLERDLEALEDNQVNTFIAAYEQKKGEKITPEGMRQTIRNGVLAYIDRVEREFKSLAEVEVKDGRVVDMESLLNNKSSVLKIALSRLLPPDYNIAGDFARRLVHDPAAEQARREQQQQDRLNDELRTTGIDLWDKHEDTVRQLDDWIDQMRALQPEDANRDSGIISFNAELSRAGVKMGQGDEKFLVTLDSNLLREMVQTDQLLECKQKYVRAFKELLGMGFDERQIVSCLSKELMLATDYGTTMQDALQRLRAKGEDKVEVVDSAESAAPVGKTRQALTDAFRELVKIRQMTKFCQDCLVRIQKEGKEKSADEDAFDKAREGFLRDFKPLVDAIKLRKGGRSIRQRLSDQLPSFIEKLLQRESEVGKRVGYLSDALGEGESADVKNKLLDQPLDINASLTAALKKFLQDKPE